MTTYLASPYEWIVTIIVVGVIAFATAKALMWALDINIGEGDK